MTLTATRGEVGQGEKLQLATFYLGEICLALEIGQIQEIIRDVRVTRVPYASAEVSGVINLRGEVTTIIDLRRVLGLPPAPQGVKSYADRADRRASPLAWSSTASPTLRPLTRRKSCRRPPMWAASTVGSSAACVRGSQKSS